MPNSLFQDLHTFRDWVRWGASQFERAELFYGHGTENAWEESLVLALWVVQQPWDRLEMLQETRLTHDEKQQLLTAIEARVERRIPAAYITGEAWFAGEAYKVSEDTLVPRSPIGELIQTGFQPWLDMYPESILDMCTGSGCIGIACAKAFEDAEVELVDISVEALRIAKENIHLHGVATRVSTCQSDGFTELEGKTYDLIVSNPPYVSEEEYADLPEEYRTEPKLGLTSGDDGFDFVREFLKAAPRHLNPGGLIVVEVGYGWEAFQAIYPDVPFFWPEFEQGGCGVFILTQQQLIDAPF